MQNNSQNYDGNDGKSTTSKRQQGIEHFQRKLLK